MFDSMQQDMRETVRLVDSLYIDLITEGLTVGNLEVVGGVKDKLKTLSSKLERLEEELYQRDIEIESLEDDLLEKDLILADRLVKKEHLEKFKGMRKAWGADMIKLRKQLDYKNSVIEKLREELDASRKEIKELETVDKVYDASNPAKRIDVDDNVIIEMYLEGRSAYSIAKVFNMTQSAIIYRLKQAGVYVHGGRDVRGKNKTESK